MLVLTLMIMGIATFLIGLLPTYEQIGPWAAVALVLLRIAQGFGVGGEWGGAVLMAVEHAPPGTRGFYGSWPQIGVPAGLLLSTAVFSMFSCAAGGSVPVLGLARAVPAQHRPRRRRPDHPPADPRDAGVRAHQAQAAAGAPADRRGAPPLPEAGAAGDGRALRRERRLLHLQRLRPDLRDAARR